MKILLIGEYSNVHWTLAQGLRALGHEAVVASDGDEWKDYPRDIDLRRRSLGWTDTLRYLWDVERLWPRLKGYDIVQIINPVFLSLKPERMWRYYERLRRQNGRIYLGAFGMDYFWVKAGTDCRTFRYSDFNLGTEERYSAWNEQMKNEWLWGEKGKLNLRIADDCDGIVSGLYEYDVCYRPYYSEKMTFIPYPVCVTDPPQDIDEVPERVRFFIGIQRGRSEYKGTDIMLRALERLQAEMPDKVTVNRAESIPFKDYETMMRGSDVLLDQLYSYTPAMNGLNAMSQGLVLVGGGEPEHYDLLGERELRPIVNVLPDEEDVYLKLRELALHPERIPQLKRQSMEYIRRHHDHLKVAQEYLDFWNKI